MAIVCQYPRTLLLSFLHVAVGVDRWLQPVVLQDDTDRHTAQAGETRCEK
jgi:hypothetical protein